MQLNHYLNFDGQTEAAFNFYKSVFGGEFATFMRYGDLPSDESSVTLSDADQQKITLNNMFNAVNNMITDGNYKGAIKKLEQIKSTLNTLKIDQTTKTELLNMINDLIDYLKTLI